MAPSCTCSDFQRNGTCQHLPNFTETKSNLIPDTCDCVGFKELGKCAHTLPKIPINLTKDNNAPPLVNVPIQLPKPDLIDMTEDQNNTISETITGRSPSPVEPKQKNLKKSKNENNLIEANQIEKHKHEKNEKNIIDKNNIIENSANNPLPPLSELFEKLTPELKNQAIVAKEQVDLLEKSGKSNEAKKLLDSIHLKMFELVNSSNDPASPLLANSDQLTTAEHSLIKDTMVFDDEKYRVESEKLDAALSKIQENLHRIKRENHCINAAEIDENIQSLSNISNSHDERRILLELSSVRRKVEVLLNKTLSAVNTTNEKITMLNIDPPLSPPKNRNKMKRGKNNNIPNFSENSKTPMPTRKNPFCTSYPCEHCEKLTQREYLEWSRPNLDNNRRRKGSLLVCETVNFLKLQEEIETIRDDLNIMIDERLSQVKLPEIKQCGNNPNFQTELSNRIANMVTLDDLTIGEVGSVGLENSQIEELKKQHEQFLEENNKIKEYVKSL